MSIRPRPALVFCDASFVPSGRAGAGFVVFHGDRIAYGACALHGIDDIDPAEMAGAHAAVSFALDAFPGIEGLVLTTDNNRVMAIPYGPTAEGFPDDHDESGVLALCRDRGVEHAVRWWPGHGRDAEARTFASNAAHALSVLGRRRGAVSGSVAGGPGWRTRLQAAIGEGAIDGALCDMGLTGSEAGTVAGVCRDTVAALMRAGHLSPDPRGGISMSSAVRVRDEAERMGLLETSPDDLGADALDVLALPSSGIVHASSGAGSALVGTCLVRVCGGRVEATGTARSIDPAAYLPHEPTRDMIDRIADLLERHPMQGVVDLFVADPFPCIAIAYGYRPTASIEASCARLDAVAAAGGMRLRVHMAKAKRFDGDGQRGVARAYQAAAKLGMALAHAGHPQDLGMGDGHGAHLALHGEMVARNAVHGLAFALAAQETVTSEALAPVIHETEAVREFEGIARAFHEGYRGVALNRWSLLPRPSADGGMRVGKAGRAKTPFGVWKAPEHLVEAWSAWCSRFAVLLDAYPDLRAVDAPVDGHAIEEGSSGGAEGVMLLAA